MRVAALYDVHGNRAALEAVLAEIEREGIEHVVSGGDVADLECVERLRAVERITFLRGNADREVPELAAVVAGWPLSAELDVDGLGPVVFCHATPRSDEEVMTRLTPDEVLREHFTAPITVIGHTHVQFDREVASIRVVNAGSVGMPYEDEAGAYWALLGPDVELRRTGYESASVPHVGPDEASAYFESRRGT